MRWGKINSLHIKCFAGKCNNGQASAPASTLYLRVCQRFTLHIPRAAPEPRREPEAERLRPREEQANSTQGGGPGKEAPQNERTGASGMGAMARVHCIYFPRFAVDLGTTEGKRYSDTADKLPICVKTALHPPSRAPSH
jgi:hypothetical protein